MFRSFATLMAVLALTGSSIRANDPVPKSAPIDVDLVICLDVSGSMSGLLESAKVKLWTIVNDLARLKPMPNLRVALYTHGGGGNDYRPEAGWVKKEIDLTTDLDEVYKRLTPLRTTGSTEYVARVTKTAITEQKWSAQKNALKILFVCGNESAAQDPANSLSSVASLAREVGVIVNTIYCGQSSDRDAAGWSEFAVMAGGRFACINHNAVHEAAIATPFDKEILEWNAKLNSTYVAYGAKGADALANQTTQDKNAEKASSQVASGGQVVNSAALSRAGTKATDLYRNSHWDLVDRIKEDPKFDVKSLKVDELCDEMKKLKPEERMEYLTKKAAERETIRKTIQELSAKRAKHIDEAKRTLPKSSAETTLDDALRAIILEQAASKGFSK